MREVVKGQRFALESKVKTQQETLERETLDIVTIRGRLVQRTTGSVNPWAVREAWRGVGHDE